MDPEPLQGNPAQQFRNTSIITDKEKAASILSPLRTYERDVADMIRKQQTSVVTVKLAEKKKEEIIRQGSASSVAEHYTRNALLAILAIALIAVGIALFGFMYYLRAKSAVVPQDKTPLASTIIPSDAERQINLTGLSYDTLTRLFSDFVKEPHADDSITHIRVVSQDTAGLTEATPELFFAAVAPRAPSSLTRAFGTTLFAGVYSLNTQYPFLIITVDSFNNAFAGMLAWEKNMYADLGPLFHKDDADQHTSAPIIINALATTTSSTTPALPVAPPPTIVPKENFEDAIIKNKDARVLRDSRDRILLIYSFIDERTLLITDSEQSFDEMITRLTTAKLIR